MSRARKLVGRITHTILAATIFLTSTSYLARTQSEQFITVGTGGVTGTFYALGSSICRIVNRDRGTFGIRCAAESTGGASTNVDAVTGGAFDFGIASADTLLNTFNGQGTFSRAGAQEQLRSVLSTYQTTIVILTSPNSDVQSFKDLAGRFVAVGMPGSSSEQAMLQFIEAVTMAGLPAPDLIRLRTVEMVEALCTGKIDAAVFFSAQPDASVNEAISTCGARMVSFTQDDQFLVSQSFPLWTPASIPMGFYRGQSGELNTLGIDVVLFTREDMDGRIVYSLVRSVFENLDLLKKLHPAFEFIKEDELRPSNSGIPIHEAAIEFFDEVGL